MKGLNPQKGWGVNPVTFRGLPVHVTEGALERVARFPDKKNTKRRRRRVIGKYGSWSVLKPVAYRIGGALVVHPEIYARLKKESRDASTSL